jgi:hypothetical protein
MNCMYKDSVKLLPISLVQLKREQFVIDDPQT